MITRRTLLLAASSAALAPALHAAPIAVTLYRDPQCGCCENYADYLRRHGFSVTLQPTNDLAEISRKAGVPPHLQGCHTAFIAGYVVDGLVPIAAVQKLLAERPLLKGITLSGMPPGAPGMIGTSAGPLTVFAIPKEGDPTIYMTI